MADFTMPALGADMETGKLVQWYVKPGDTVHSGDVVAVVETHKGAIDVECFLEGTIDHLAPLGAEMPVGGVLATVQGAEAAVMDARAPQATEIPPLPQPSSPLQAELAAGGRRLISPAARRKASELDLALEQVHGTGENGAITLADVELASRQPHPAARVPAATEDRPASRPSGQAGFDPQKMRQAIAAAMGKSKRDIPHYYLTSTIDFGEAQAWLDAWNSTHEPIDRLLPAVLLLKASARALKLVPQLNGFYVNGEYRASSAVHLGWAVALRGGGLIAPAIHDADQKSLTDLMAALRDLVQRARSGGLRSSELTDPTATVTSLGDRGAESVLGVIYPPQVAILGFGRIVQRPWVVDGQLMPRPLVNVSLAADHRASDGHVGGRLLAAIDSALQDPINL